MRKDGEQPKISFRKPVVMAFAALALLTITVPPAHATTFSNRKAKRGDLAFFGDGHVELVDHGDITFGAHATGQQIGWITTNSYWHPTAYYRVRGAGRANRGLYSSRR